MFRVKHNQLPLFFALFGVFLLVFIFFPKPSLAKILESPDIIRVSVGGLNSGEVKTRSAGGGSCLRAMKPEGLLPIGVKFDFKPECGQGEWVSTFQVSAEKTARVGSYQIGFVEIPKSGPPAVSVWQLTLLVTIPTLQPTALVTRGDTPATSPPATGSGALTGQSLFTALGIFLVTLVSLGFLVRRRLKCRGCGCEEIKLGKGKSPVTASAYKKRLLFCQKCDSMLDQQTKFCDHCVKFQKSSRQEEIPHVKIVIPVTYAVKCEQTKPNQECFASIVSYVKSQEWRGAALEKDITKGLTAEIKQGIKLEVANEKIDPSPVECKGKCDGKLPKNPADWNLNCEAAIITGESASRVGIDEKNPLCGKLVFEIVGTSCAYNEALEVEVELSFTQFKQSGTEGVAKKGDATIGVKIKGFFKKWEKDESPEDYEKKNWTQKKEK